MFAGYRFAFTAIAPQSLLQWNSAPYLNYHVFAGPSPDSITNIVATSLPSAGNTTSWTIASITNRQFYRLQIAP
jgi:hypothetical protein